MQTNKQINKDWTLRESSRIHKRNSVVIDAEGNLGVVVKTQGDLVNRAIWVENESGEEIYSGADSENFTRANNAQHKAFYLQYKVSKGWEIGKIYTLRDRDYPLLLEDMEYDTGKQAMLYIFRDLNESSLRYLKSSDEMIVSPIEKWEEEATMSAFVKDMSSRLSHDIEINVRVEENLDEGWSVSGRSFSFDSGVNANVEIEKWVNRMRIRRLSSVLQTAKSGESSQISLSSEGNLYISKYTENIGQPAIFVSRVAAALALVFLGEEIWKSALEISLDKYDI